MTAEEAATTAEVTRLLNQRYDAWSGSPAVAPKQITASGLLVHATLWGGLPGVPSKADPPYADWRNFVGKHWGLTMVRNEADGMPTGETPASLTLLNRGLSRLVGGNAVACCEAYYDEPHQVDAQQDKPKAARECNATGRDRFRDVPGQIMLAAGNLGEGSVRCAFARDGQSNIRERGCGCVQSPERQGMHSGRQRGPAISLAVNLSQYRSRLDSPSPVERPFYAREQWGRCQRGGEFYCDALRPRGMHASATDGSCLVTLADAASGPMRRSRCGSSLCAWRPGQARQLLAAQEAVIGAIKAGRIENLLLGNPVPDMTGWTLAPLVATLYNHVIVTYRAMVPSINAVLVMGPKAGGRSDPVSIRRAHSAAWAVSAARGRRHIPVLCLRRSPRPDEAAIVPLDRCA